MRRLAAGAAPAAPLLTPPLRRAARQSRRAGPFPSAPRRARRRSRPGSLPVMLIGFLVSGCAQPQHRPQAAPPSLAPATQPSASLQIDASRVQPMYRQLLAVDLPTVIRVASAQNLDIEQARQRVLASRG